MAHRHAKKSLCSTISTRRAESISGTALRAFDAASPPPPPALGSCPPGPEGMEAALREVLPSASSEAVRRRGCVVIAMGGLPGVAAFADIRGCVKCCAAGAATQSKETRAPARLRLRAGERWAGVVAVRLELAGDARRWASAMGRSSSALIKLCCEARRLGGAAGSMMIAALRSDCCVGGRWSRERRAMRRIDLFRRLLPPTVDPLLGCASERALGSVLASPS
mmetsp:Transcript_22484/g.57595  ORF Transcript_22484/g.57595 Transcript_22484/m.57595 type:complete len:223 (-) Transcript_22484:1818-2486(-)